jgi:5-methylcytosine-specific restriction protein B
VDFQLSPRLKVLATRNTSDRTIARMDVAIRRRFSFFTVWPDPRPVEAQKDELAIRCFNDCLDVFTEYADEETLRLLPGHAYFLDPNASDKGRDERIRARLEHELLPLLRDYLSERLCGAAALVDRIEARVAAANAQK